MEQSEAIQRILETLKNGSLNERRLALNELAKTDPSLAIPALESLLDSKDFSLRKFVAMGLGNHICAPSFELLATMASEETDPNVLAEVANSLYEFGDRALEILSTMFCTHEHWLLRQTILSLMAESQNDQKIWEVTLLALEDQHQTVKETGIFALGLLLRGDYKAKAWEKLEQLAKDSFWRTRWRVAIALQHGQKDEVIALLQQLKNDEHFRVVAAALEIMGTY